ncbi:MAG TPA: SRPBCC domain-containing protein [Terriglobales bacterium]
MTSSRITPDQDAIVSETHIAAPPERVFQALIEPEQAMQWWDTPEAPIESFALDPRKGGRWSYSTRQATINVNGVTRFQCEGEVVEFDPPRLLAYTWISNWHADKNRATLVRWELSAEAGGTRLKVTHSGLAHEETARKDYSGGWPGLLETLRKHCERHATEI